MSTPATRPQIEAVLDEFRVVIRYPDLTVCSPSGVQELAAAYVEARATIARLEGELEVERMCLAACAVAAWGGEVRDTLSPYDSDSLRAVVALRTRADAAERERDSARAANERDRAGYFYSVESLRRLIARWGWVGDSERNTAMDEETCREQFTRCMAELRKIANRMERKTHARDLSDCPTTTAGVEAALAAASGAADGAATTEG